MSKADKLIEERNRLKKLINGGKLVDFNGLNLLEENIADILTRGVKPDMLGPGSAWQCGPDWMVKDGQSLILL